MKSWIVSLIALPCAALAASQSGTESAAPDRRQIVAGWQIDDIADPQNYDPDRRAVRMQRTGESWEIGYEFVLGAVPVEPSRNQRVVIGGCNRGLGSSRRDGTPAERAAAARATFATLIAEAAEACTLSGAPALAGLAGFEEAFAFASAWDAERDAMLSPIRAAREAEADETADLMTDGDMDALDGMDMDATSNSLDATPQ